MAHLVSYRGATLAHNEPHKGAIDVAMFLARTRDDKKKCKLIAMP